MTEHDFHGGQPNPLLIDWEGRSPAEGAEYERWYKQSVLSNASRLIDALQADPLVLDWSPSSIGVLDDFLRSLAAVRAFGESVDRGRGGFGLFLCSFSSSTGATVVLDDRTLYLCALVSVYCAEVYRREALKLGIVAKWRRSKSRRTLSFGQMEVWTKTRSSTGGLDFNVEVVRRVRHCLERGDRLVVSSLVDVVAMAHQRDIEL